MKTLPGSVDVSIIVPLFNEVDNVFELVTQLAAAMNGGHRSWELICVDDRSTDDTAVLLAQLAIEHGFLRPLYLSRN